MDFRAFKIPVASQFARLSKYQLFRTDVDKDLLWSTYLESFPEGANLIFRKRLEYDCSCCRQFIRAVGNVVGIRDGEIVSLWDVACDEPAYQSVADALKTLVKSRPISNIFLYTETVAGTDKSFEKMIDRVVTWNHFFVNIPASFVCRGEQIGPRLSEARALHDVFHRSLTEITDEAIETVLDLIAQKSLYRGEEHKHAVIAFRTLKRGFIQVPLKGRDAFVWSNILDLPVSVSKIRNTAMGTLLVNLSDGMEIETAVGKFEALVAPTNYRRPTALVTPKMIENAKQALQELGLISALERRYARLNDINANDILFVDRSARRTLERDVFDSLPTKAHNPKSFDRVDEVPIDTFLSDIVPRAESIEIFLENRHAPNLVSLIAPVDATANDLFKWNNLFSWSYNGDLADSIKERVKQAGGNVTGELLCRLSWSNYDDLDLHMIEPNGYPIYFGNKGCLSPCGGKLDVDMNAGSGTTRTPVENIFYSNLQRMQDGLYKLRVHNYFKRESVDVGFTVQFEHHGNIHLCEHPYAVPHGHYVDVLSFDYSHTSGIEIVKSIESTPVPKTLWGLKTQQFHRVNVVMMSPNYWGDRPLGNKHYFFMLEGCRNDGQARGFFNEFLKDELIPHRKVIEMVGARMKTEDSAEQLSGLGFSSTQKNNLLVKVKGSFTRTIKVIF
jgi:hypothetical protein